MGVMDPDAPPSPPTLPNRATTDDQSSPAGRLRRRVWELVEPGRGDDPGGDGIATSSAASRGSDARYDWFDWTIALLIVLNVVALMLESDRPTEAAYHRWFVAFEAFSLIVFGVEYVLRLWACTADPRFARPIAGRLRYAVRPLQLIDLLALLPAALFFLPGVPDLRFVRAVRLLRILRVLKLGRYSDAVTLLGRVLRQRRAELAVMGLVLVILLVVAASALHYAEADAQPPDKFGSIPHALWWAVITLTTIGYGDVYPVTPLGKVLGGLIAVAGIGIVALPTAIIASAFSEELRKAFEGGKQADPMPEAAAGPGGAGAAGHLACPHCGKPIALHAAPAAAG